MLCNKCYEKGKKVEMALISHVEPQSPLSKGALFNPITGEVQGKPKYQCPRCGYIKSGRGKSLADLQEEMLKSKSVKK